MGKHIKRERRPGLLVFVFMLWIVFSLLAVRAWLKPLELEETIKENSIVWTSNYDYEVELSSCALYPEGGVHNITGVIFPTLTEKLIISVETKLNAEKPVSAQGGYRLISQLTAEDLWTKDFPLTDVKSFAVQGERGNIIKEKVVLNLEEFKAFIDQVEKETGNSRRTYSLAVKPELTGTLVYDKKTLPLQEESSLQFTYEPSEIKLVGEQNFSTDLFFEKRTKKLQSFVLAGQSFPLVEARRLFTGLSFLFLLLWVYQVRQHHLIKKGWSESQKIDKKYGSRLIYVAEKVAVCGKTKIRLHSFQSLLQIAEEREIPICRVCPDGFKVVYFVSDHNYFYYYPVEERLTVKQGVVRAESPMGSRSVYG